MAKMFYTLEEVAEKLGKTEDEVKEMAQSGQIQEFRDRDKLMFKVEQIDLLAEGDDDDDDVESIDLEESSGGSGIALADSDTGRSDSDMGMSDSREGTGLSVFDTDHGEEKAESEEDGEKTHVGADTVDDDLGLESVGSGSGLLDLTKESDDTAVGAELLEDVYSSEEQVEMPAGASGLFEAADTDQGGEEFAATGGGRSAMPVAIEVYDGSGSGLGVGMLVGAATALVCMTIIAVVGVTGATPQLAMQFAENLWIWVGGLAGLTIVLGLIGWFIGKASE